MTATRVFIAGLLFFDFPSETNFTDSDSNWRFGAVNRHLRQRALRKMVFVRKGDRTRIQAGDPCDIRLLSSRLRSCIATEYVHLE
jgi:hypothetical protein